MKRLIITIAVAFAATAAVARVISYAPYTDRTAVPAEQHRMNRYFVLLETPSVAPGPGTVTTPPPPPPQYICCYTSGQLVLYDTKGENEPRVVLPPDGTSVTGIAAVAVRETGGVPYILAQTTYSPSATPVNKLGWMLSTDGGSTWKSVALPYSSITQVTAPDMGGPFVRGRYNQIRIGTNAYPFVISLGAGGVFAIGADGTTKTLVPATAASGWTRLLGSDASGSKFLVQVNIDLQIVDLNGVAQKIGSINTSGNIDGWITPSGAAYVDERSYMDATLWLYANGDRSAVMTGISHADYLFQGLIDIPTADYSGAWIVTRGPSLPTTLYRHSPGADAQKQWEDVTAPEVEALHAAASGTSLLIQVHRQRPQADQRMFRDPALAVWHPGEPPPRAYDELFMNEMDSKAFVHLDVDAAEHGGIFVFDSGAQNVGYPVPMPSPGAPPPASGGSDVIQEWGVVRASLAQRLVLTSVGRTPGAYGSFWMTDVIIHNPLATAQDVKLEFVESGAAPNAQSLHQATVTLNPHEIRLVPDVLSTVFNMQTGNGALFLTPASGVNVTSRTYTRSDKGTYGFGMNGIDVYTAANARFPLTFAGAFQGRDFRTNLVLTDVSGRGAAAAALAVSVTGTVSSGNDVVFSAPANGQQQYNGLSERLTQSTDAAGALLVRPQRGDVITSLMVVDNKTNDPTYFPPDLPSSSVRVIPAIGHLDGANGSKFRTDLFIYNPYDGPRNLMLQIKAWDSNDGTVVALTLLGNESRIIRDVLFRAFNRTGIARLRFLSTSDTIGVRMTARTYSVNDDGGTYGYLMPALNNFQSAAPGDALEILGVAGGQRFRTNIGLVELTANPNGTTSSVRVEIIDDKGATLDSFTTNIAVAGGMQINDIFHARGLGDGPAVALIRVTPLSGMFAAYATTIDNGTNDPVYLAANLAAHQ